MNYPYNPYAAPQAAPPPVQGPIQSGAPQPWTVGEVISIAWERFKVNWAVLVFTYFVMSLIVYALMFGVLFAVGASGVQPDSGAFVGIYLGVEVLLLVIISYFQVGLMRVWLEVARGGTPSFGLMFSGFDRFLPFLGFMLLFGILLDLGLLFLIVPGIILALALCLGQWFVVDAKMGPIAALTASWEATKGHKGDLFVLALASFGLWILGALMCGLGTFATFPLTFVAFGVAYTRMSGFGVVPATSQEYAPGLPPPGGYGPPPGFGPGAPPGTGGPPGYGPSGYGGPPGYGPPGPPPGYGPPR